MGRRGPVTRAVGRERRDSRGRARAEVRGGRARRGGEDILGGGGEPAPAPLATRPVSTGGGTRRVQSVREGWGGGGQRLLRARCDATQSRPRSAATPCRPRDVTRNSSSEPKAKSAGGAASWPLPAPASFPSPFSFCERTAWASASQPSASRGAAGPSARGARGSSRFWNTEWQASDCAGRTRRARLVCGEGRDVSA
jgi:hypothetical protein